MPTLVKGLSGVIKNLIDKEFNKYKSDLILKELLKANFMKTDPFRSMDNYRVNSRFNFIDLVRGLVPKKFYKIIRKYLPEPKIIKDIIKETLLSLADLKWDRWKSRCEEFLKWKTQNGISKEDKLKKVKRKHFKQAWYQTLKENLASSCRSLTNKVLINFLTNRHGFHDTFFFIDKGGVLTSL